MPLSCITFHKRHASFFKDSRSIDPTLRHLLRQSAVINPGHYHFTMFNSLDPMPEGTRRQNAQYGTPILRFTT